MIGFEHCDRCGIVVIKRSMALDSFGAKEFEQIDEQDKHSRPKFPEAIIFQSAPESRCCFAQLQVWTPRRIDRYANERRQLCAFRGSTEKFSS